MAAPTLGTRSAQSWGIILELVANMGYNHSGGVKNHALLQYLWSRQRHRALRGATQQAGGRANRANRARQVLYHLRSAPNGQNDPLAPLARCFSEQRKLSACYAQFWRDGKLGKLTYDQLEFTLERDGKTIHVYLVRLGALFEKQKETSSHE